MPYFSSLKDNDDEALDIIYSLETQKKQKGDILQRRGDDADELFFL